MGLARRAMDSFLKRRKKLVLRLGWEVGRSRLTRRLTMPICTKVGDTGRCTIFPIGINIPKGLLSGVPITGLITDGQAANTTFLGLLMKCFLACPVGRLIGKNK